MVTDWCAAQAELAVDLAKVATRFGALDERLRKGPPDGWRHRLALAEASELSWLSGERVTADRLGLWQAMRVGGAAGEDTAALQRAAWAFRRLSSGAGGPQADLGRFLGRHEVAGTDRLSDRIAGWQEVMATATALHPPLVRACFALALWPPVPGSVPSTILEVRWSPHAWGGPRATWAGGQYFCPWLWAVGRSCSGPIPPHVADFGFGCGRSTKLF